MSSKRLVKLGDLLTPGTVRARVPADEWSEAVDRCGELLVASGSCEARYVEAMVQAVRELGPYIVIAPGIAMPHARPEQGVLKPGVAIITLDNPVAFGNPANDPVDLIIAFAAQDKGAHLNTLQSIAALLTDEETLARTRSAVSDAALAEVLGVAA